MDFRPQVAPEHYDLEYDHKERFISYWTQIHEVVRLHPKSVLEIGIGNGFVHRYLRQRGFNVHTVDADARLEPDTVALIESLPFRERQFDVVCCFETLEHLPFEKFHRAVKELARVAEKWVLISVPDVTPYARIHFEWGFRKRLVSKFFDLPARRMPEHQFDGEHYWEIGKRGYPLGRILSEIEAAGLTVEATPRIEEDAWHRFFRCRVRR
ncbi:MAG: class I SAM-dependent methyltransferase [Myxococcales bacterium]|nr:class I SAM-dependent methyltransferase [Myxococcales bacterium]